MSDLFIYYLFSSLSLLTLSPSASQFPLFLDHNCAAWGIKESLATVQSNGENKSCFLLEQEEGCGHRARILPGTESDINGSGEYWGSALGFCFTHRMHRYYHCCPRLILISTEDVRFKCFDYISYEYLCFMQNCSFKLACYFKFQLLVFNFNFIVHAEDMFVSLSDDKLKHRTYSYKIWNKILQKYVKQLLKPDTQTHIKQMWIHVGTFKFKNFIVH